MKLFAYDGRLADTMLAAFWFFVTSVFFLMCCLPLFAFDTIIGAQSTHLAIVLGTLALAPIGPGVYAVLTLMRDFVVERGYPGTPFRTFCRAYASGLAELWWLWAGGMAASALLAYNLALYGESDAVFLVVLLAAAVGLIVALAVIVLTVQGVSGRPTLLITKAVGALARRPVVGPAWLMLIAACAASTALPLIGTALTLFVPAGCAWAMLTVAGAQRFGANATRRSAHSLS